MASPVYSLPPLRLIVSGDRNWGDDVLVRRILTLFTGDRAVTIIEGAARGADTMAGEWAKQWEADGVTLEVYPADWAQHGKAAGPIRNRAMLASGSIDAVLAFHDNLEESRGTRDMVRAARAAHVPVLLCSHRGVLPMGEWPDHLPVMWEEDA